jgi:hypothetical protein
MSFFILSPLDWFGLKGRGGEPMRRPLSGHRENPQELQRFFGLRLIARSVRTRPPRSRDA